MTALPAIPWHEPETVPRADYLGPAAVLETSGAEVRLRLAGGRERVATMALAFPYRPEPGDELLVIGKDDAYFVIGVIAGCGQATLEFAGDVELRSLGGKVAITAAQGIELRSKVLSLYADKVKTVADTVSETVNHCVQRVREMLSVQAGESRTVVRGHWYAQSKRAQINTEENISINGKQIHLG